MSHALNEATQPDLSKLKSGTPQPEIMAELIAEVLTGGAQFAQNSFHSITAHPTGDKVVVHIERCDFHSSKQNERATLQLTLCVLQPANPAS